MYNTYIILGAIITFGTLLGIIVYLYRESALLQGKTEIGLGPIKFKLKKVAPAPGEQTTPPDVL